MQFKYQDLGEGIIKLLKQRKQNGENIMVIRATEVWAMPEWKVCNDLSGYEICVRPNSSKTD